MTASSRTVRLATRLHRALLWLVPSEVRRDYGAEMIATFEAAATDARRAGPLAVCRLLFHEILDLAWSRRANRPAGVAYPPAPSVAAGSHQRGEWIQMWAWRQAWRSLARRPAFFAAAVLTLAFGAGVTTAVFSLVDTVLIKPLPYPDADALVTVYELSPSARERRSLVAPGRLAGLAPFQSLVRGDLRDQHRERHRYERPGARASCRRARGAAVLRGLRPTADCRPVVYRGRGAGHRSECGGDQRAVLDEALQSRSLGDWPGAHHRRQGISDRRRDAGLVHRRDHRRVAAGEDERVAARAAGSALPQWRRPAEARRDDRAGRSRPRPRAGKPGQAVSEDRHRLVG